MKREFFTILCTVFLFLSTNIQAQTLVLDFEAPATSDPFGLSMDGFGGAGINGVVADPLNASNNVLSITKGPISEVWAGVASLVTPGLIDLTTDTEICLDFYEEDATGTLLIKLELSSNGGGNWELLVNTTMGWNNYCVNTTLTGQNGEPPAAGFIYEKLVIFPDFGMTNSDQDYYFDNIYVNPILCDLAAAAGTATCNANTAGVDTYDATFTFSQTAAPGAGTYTLSTNSGGTIGGDDPNLLAAGTITISGINEGTAADLNITDGANCDIDVLVNSPNCLPLYDVTFQLNMCEQINLGNFDPATQAVFVAGGATYPACGAMMTDADMDNVYELTNSYVDGSTVFYKFYIATPADANTGNCTGAGFEGNLPAPCGFGQFSDRQVVINGMDEVLPSVCFSSCDDCTSCSCDLLLVAGTTTCDALTSGVDTYEATFTFTQTTAPGAGTYTLTTNSGGTIGGDDPDLMVAGTITISGISEGTDADLNLSDGAGCNLDEVITSPACVPQFDITFQVNMCEQISAGNFDPATQAVFIAGGATYPACSEIMTDADMDNVYELTRSFDDGASILYKYYIATPADANTGNCGGAGFEAPLVPCGVGQFMDRELIVNGMDEILPSVCFGSCDDCTTCTCDLQLMAGTATCDALTSGVDTYEATFTFTQTTAPGGGTYTLTTNSGGTIGGDDPDLMVAGTITISGISEGTDADLNLSDGAGCDLDGLVTSPACIPQYDITFQVNMCEQIDAGNFDPATQAVFVAGGPAYPNCGEMMLDPDGDNVFELTNTYDDGTAIVYKYYIATPADANTGNCGGAGFEDPLVPCGVGMYNDRQHIVNGMDETIGSVCFSSCDDCTTCFDPCPPDYAGANQLTGTESDMILYATNGILDSDQLIDATADVEYNSAIEINLLPGFETILGAIFDAIIAGCVDVTLEENPDAELKMDDSGTESQDKN